MQWLGAVYCNNAWSIWHGSNMASKKKASEKNVSNTNGMVCIITIQITVERKKNRAMSCRLVPPTSTNYLDK